MYVGNMDNCLFSPATFTGGLEYQYNSLHDVMTGYGRDLRQDVKIASGFVQNEWKLDYFTILAGFRLDKHNLVDNVISVRVSIPFGNLLINFRDVSPGRRVSVHLRHTMRTCMWRP